VTPKIIVYIESSGSRIPVCTVLKVTPSALETLAPVCSINSLFTITLAYITFCQCYLHRGDDASSVDNRTIDFINSDEIRRLDWQTLCWFPCTDLYTRNEPT